MARKDCIAAHMLLWCRSHQSSTSRGITCMQNGAKYACMEQDNMQPGLGDVVTSTAGLVACPKLRLSLAARLSEAPSYSAGAAACSAMTGRSPSAALRMLAGHRRVSCVDASATGACAAVCEHTRG